MIKARLTRKKVIELFKTFVPIRERRVSCTMGTKQFYFWLSKKDDLQSFARNDNFENYENRSLLYWQENCSDGIAIDIGAYTGIYSIVAGISGAAKIFAFEPNELSRDQFKKNISLNSIRNIDLSNLALSDKHGIDYLMMPKIRLNLNPRTHGSGVQLKNSPINRDQKRWERGPEVRVSTLDTQIPIELHAKIQIIKIDVEGAELAVLQGATNILKLSKSKLIIESLEPSTTESIVKYLETFSYKHTNTLSKNLTFEKG
jgi:FkbM family methyltransferase